MASRKQMIRHNTSQANAFQGLQGEPTMDTTAGELRLHDGLSPGGIKIARADLLNVPDATSSVSGKMTATHVANLAAVIANLIIETAARFADVDAEEGRALAAEAVIANALDAFIATKAAVNGLASLNGSGAVVQNALTATNATTAAACSGNSATVSNGVYLTGAQTLADKTLTSPVLNGSLTGTGLVDEDNMVSDSVTRVPTQQSVKAYVDNAKYVAISPPATANYTMAGTGTVNWATQNWAVLNGTNARVARIRVTGYILASAAGTYPTILLYFATSGQSGAPSGFQYRVFSLYTRADSGLESLQDTTDIDVILDSNQDFQLGYQAAGHATTTFECRVIGYWKN